MPRIMPKAEKLVSRLVLVPDVWELHADRHNWILRRNVFHQPRDEGGEPYFSWENVSFYGSLGRSTLQAIYDRILHTTPSTDEPSLLIALRMAREAVEAIIEAGFAGK